MVGTSQWEPVRLTLYKGFIRIFIFYRHADLYFTWNNRIICNGLYNCQAFVWIDLWKRVLKQNSDLENAKRMPDFFCMMPVSKVREESIDSRSRSVLLWLFFLTHRKLRFPMSKKPSDTPKVCWMQHSRARNYVAEATALGARVSQARLFFIHGKLSRWYVGRILSGLWLLWSISVTQIWSHIPSTKFANHKKHNNKMTKARIFIL